MKGLILLANHFEDTEAIVTIDLLRRADIQIDLVSINSTLELKTQYNLTIKADFLIEEIDVDEYDFLIIPGGKAIFEIHQFSEITKCMIEIFYRDHKLIATICAAPMLLGQYNYLNNVPFTCFPSCETKITNGKYLSEEKVVVYDNIITAKAAGATFEFAYEIIKYLKGNEIAEKILRNVYYK